MGVIMSMRKILTLLGTLAVTWLVVGTLGSFGHAQSGETILTGKITSATGGGMEGVIVSARRLGSTFTTSVYSDSTGQYYFPKLQQGRYHIWAQAVGFDAPIYENATLSGPVHRQDMVMKALPNYEMQLRGDEWVASLPENTDQDRKMKEVFRLTCYGGCHSPSHALKDRYDEKGWRNHLEIMMRAGSGGQYSMREDSNVSPLLHYYRDELVAWLAQIRGPNSPPLKLQPRPRPTGEETLGVWREYDATKPGYGVPLYNDGTLWQLGPPNKMDGRNQGLLRATIDTDGNPWHSTGSGGVFSYRSFGKFDWKTGKATNYRAINENGQMNIGDEMIADRHGVVWVYAGPNLGRVGRDGRLELIKIPETIPPASSVKLDPATAKDRIWFEQQSSFEDRPTRLWMYDPAHKQWAAWENPRTEEAETAFNEVYNVIQIADADGNGWFSQHGTDVIVKLDGSQVGKTVGIRVPQRNNPVWELFQGDDRKIFEISGGPEPHGRGHPLLHTIRMMGTGPGPTDSAWGSGWFSSDLIRVNIKTNRVQVYRAPFVDCGPYHSMVDPQGYVWTVCHSADYLRRFDPKTERFIRFDMPSISTDAHGMGVAPVLINGRVRAVVPSWTTSKLMMLEVRTTEDIQALRAEVQQGR
jgi:streptogramin lyase